MVKRAAHFFKTVTFFILLIGTCQAAQMHPFNLPTVDGGTRLSSQAYQGKVLIIDFWASWCAPCKASFSAYNELSKKFKGKDFEIIAFSIDDDIKNAQSFLKENPAHFITVHDADKKVAELYNLPTMPTSFVVDRKGEILHTHAGFRDGDLAIIEKEVSDALSK